MAPDPETIAAVATATGPAGVGIVRLSGPDAFCIVDRLRDGRARTAKQPGHTLRRALLRDPCTREPIDDALLAVFHAPRSFTGENVVEIQGHGGTITLRRLLDACLAAGARLARPGEFSERAFVNGKLDLSQAEAIADLIAAQTVAAQRAALQQVDGALSRPVGNARRELRSALAAIEASIDFPEEIGEIDRTAVANRLDAATSILNTLRATATYGRRLRDGIRLVLTGRPNVGKSSLLNALSGTDRAIVTPVAGTTRDIVEESMQIDGIPIRALDTAGIRTTDDPVEQIGIDRARQALAAADLAIVVLDAAAGFSDDDRDLFAELPDDLPRVVALNKADIGDANTVIKEWQLQFGVAIAIVPTSAPTGAGIDALRAAVAAALGSRPVDANAPLVTSARHDVALGRAAEAIDAAQQTLALGLPAELIAVDVHGALQALGEITGETVREEIIAGIFAEFCIGK